MQLAMLFVVTGVRQTLRFMAHLAVPHLCRSEAAEPGKSLRDLTDASNGQRNDDQTPQTDEDFSTLQGVWF